MALVPGQLISHYRIVGPVGAGGMGEVYRAADMRLNRDVAIKVLPEGWDDEPRHVQRFEREARSLAALSHQYVAHVYGFDQFNGRHYLVIEFVEGEELATRLRRGPLPVDVTIELCRQIAEGLEATHEIGVVHRDLKPANIRVTPEGVVKILDFGLAKSFRPGRPEGEPTPEDPPSIVTQVGQLVGTPTYMSPESIRGRHVDRRADIWAFGCVVYECLTGRSAFGGDTVADTVAAILEQEPDLSRLPRGTPQTLCDLISRCLVKEPRARLRDIGEARVLLERGVTGPPTAAAVPVTGGRLSATLTVLLAAAVSVAAWATLREPASRPASADVLAGATFTKLTDTDASEFDAALSRDGRFVAFASDRSGQFEAWVGQLDSSGQLGPESFLNVTQGRKKFWGLKVRDLGFHVDGTRVWINMVVGDSGSDQMNVCPILGGEFRPILGEQSVNADWSPDGRMVAYHTSHDGDPVFIADADGSDPRELVRFPGSHQHYPMWSSDGQWIYLVRGRPATLAMDLWRIREDGTDLERLTFDKRDVAYPTPIDAKTLLYVARESNGAGPWLWELDLGSKSSRRADYGVEQYLSIAASRDGRRLVAAVANPRSELWTVPILPDREADIRDAAPVAGLESVRAQAPRIHGDRIYFLSSRANGDGLWLYSDGKTVELLRGRDAPLLHAPAVSPDGGALAVALEREGRMRLCLVDAKNAVPRQLSDLVEISGAAAWSPDGQWIAAGGEDAEGPGLFLFPSDGGAPRRLVAEAAFNPVWSPRDDLIVYMGRSTRGAHDVFAVRPTDGSRIEEFPTFRVIRIGERFRFTPDGSELIYMQGGERIGQDLWLLDLATWRSRRIATFDDSAEMRSFDVDSSGTRIIFDRLRLNSDVVLIVRPPVHD